jgi:DHA1 family bicyclomycin/chloramphenicol resistance-like MFS transporter
LKIAPITTSESRMALSVRTGWGGLAGLVVPLFLFISAAGFIVANSIVRALAGFSERAGAVSAPVGAFADGTPLPMGGVIALAGIGSLLCARLLVPAHASGTLSETANRA